MKFEKMSKAAVLRWQNNPTMIQLRRAAALKQNLKLLKQVMGAIRVGISRQLPKVYKPRKPTPEKRAYALARYHSGENIARQLRERPRTLERAFRRVIKRSAREKIKNQIEIEKAYRRVLLRQNNQIEQRLANRLRKRFEKAFKCRKPSRVCMELTGTSVAGLRAHLESLFKSGMTWENYGFWGWHIDHIKPICTFDLKSSEQQRACFHYSNLQPLWQAENLAKSRK